MDLERTLEKYTRQPIDPGLLWAARSDEHPTLADAIIRAVIAIHDVETHLARTADSVADSVDKARKNITAAPGQRIFLLNSYGELQSAGPRFDALVAVRAERIEHLNTLVQLWHAQQEPAS